MAKFELGGEVFPTKGAPFQEIARIQHAWSSGGRITGRDAVLVRAAFERHPEFAAKSAKGIDHFFVMKNEAYFKGVWQDCFYVVHPDGTWTHWSFHDAFDPTRRPIEVARLLISGQQAEAKREHFGTLLVFGFNRIPIVAWLREQAAESLTHAQQAGEMITHLGDYPSLAIGPLLGARGRPGVPTARTAPKAFAKCQLTGKRIGRVKCDTHHVLPWSFPKTRHSFVAGWGEPEIKWGPHERITRPTFVDPVMVANWLAYHECRATLLVVHRDAHKVAHGRTVRKPTVPPTGRPASPGEPGRSCRQNSTEPHKR